MSQVTGPVTASLAQLLGISASRIKVVSVHSNHRRSLLQSKGQQAMANEEGGEEEEEHTDQLLSLPSPQRSLYWSSSEVATADGPDPDTLPLPSLLQQHRTLQTDDSVSLQFEILPDTPTVALTVGG